MEAYQGLTPKDLEELTPDQLYIMYCDKQNLKTVERVSTDQLRARGVLPEVKPGEPTSLVQRIRQQEQEQAARQQKEGKRERRKRREQELREARERGEA